MGTYDFDIAVDDGLFAGSAAAGSDVVVGAVAAADAVVVTRKTLAAVVEFARRTRRDAVRTVFDVLALGAVARPGAHAVLLALVVAVLAQFLRNFVDSIVNK